MAPLQDVSERLASIKTPGRFATRRTSATDDLRLEVKGVGRVTWPVARTMARRLCAIARPARYGLKTETRFDPRVRDTWEIPKSRIRIDEPRWRKTFRPLLDRVRRDLGLADGSRLKAELHNMLVYGPGQFFAGHRDSEKADHMIGTLVVILPSEFTGGAIEIEHDDERLTYRGHLGKLTFVAFYADCHHQVRPVSAGHRIVLTYNLMIEVTTPVADAALRRPRRADRSEIVRWPLPNCLPSQTRSRYRDPRSLSWSPRNRPIPPIPGLSVWSNSIRPGTGGSTSGSERLNDNTRSTTNVIVGGPGLYGSAQRCGCVRPNASVSAPFRV